MVDPIDVNRLCMFLEAHNGELLVNRRGPKREAPTSLVIRVWRDGKKIEKCAPVPERSFREEEMGGAPVYEVLVAALIHEIETENPSMRVR